jgi:hypothetical protein
MYGRGSCENGEIRAALIAVALLMDSANAEIFGSPTMTDQEVKSVFFSARDKD